MLLLKGNTGLRKERSADDLSTSLPHIRHKMHGGKTWHGSSHAKQGIQHAAISGRPADDIEQMRYSAVVPVERTISYGEPQSAGRLEARRDEVFKAATVGEFEGGLGSSEREIVAEMRAQLTAVRVDPTQVLKTLSRLLEFFVHEVQTKDDGAARLRAELKKVKEDAAGEHAALRVEIEGMEEVRSQLERKIVEEEAEKDLLNETIKGLEEALKEKNSVGGVTYEEIAMIKTHLAKARAAADSWKKQVEGMQDKMLAAESAKRAEELALREKRGQIEREMKELKENYGPERVKEMQAQLEETLSELDQVKDQLRKQKMAGQQQHKLVVEWKIKVTDIGHRLTEQNTTLKEQEDELEVRAKHIDDLKATVVQLQQDLTKTMTQLGSTNTQLTDYVEKFTRLTAHVKRQEGMWKVMQAKQRLLLQSQGDVPPDDDDPPDNGDDSTGAAQKVERPPGTAATGGISRVQSNEDIEFFNVDTD